MDYLAWLAWTKTKDAQYNRGRPTPIPRPGVDTGTTQIGRAPLPLDEMDDWLGWTRPPVVVEAEQLLSVEDSREQIQVGAGVRTRSRP